MEKNKYLQLIIQLINKNDPYKSGHSKKVAKLSNLIGLKLSLTEDELKDLEIGSLLHDLGKTLLPGELWCIPDKLDPEEKEIVQKHSIMGADLLNSCNFNDNIIKIVKYHHERWDGTGYPDQLSENEIPLLSRITALAEAYISMISYDIYSSDLEKEEAIQEIETRSGTQFAPEIVKVFLSIMEEK